MYRKRGNIISKSENIGENELLVLSSSEGNVVLYPRKFYGDPILSYGRQYYYISVSENEETHNDGGGARK